MDWIHCNNCFSQLEPGITLHLTSCGHMFCNKCLDNGTKSKDNSTCLVCRLPCSVMKLVPDMKPEVQDYFTEPEEFIKKCSEVLQFQRQHRRRLLAYLLQSTKKFFLARTELKRMTEICQKQHKQLRECQKTIKNLESQLANKSKKTPRTKSLLKKLNCRSATTPYSHSLAAIHSPRSGMGTNNVRDGSSKSPFNIPISPGTNLSPGYIQTAPAYKRPAKSTPYTPYQSNLVTPSRISKERSSNHSGHSQRSNTSNKISSTVFTPLTPDSVGNLTEDSPESGYFSNSPLEGVLYCNGSGKHCSLKNGMKRIKQVMM